MRHCQSQRLQIISVTLPWRISYTAHLCSNTLHNYHSYSATYWNLLQWLWQPFLSTFVWLALKVQRNQSKALNHPCRSYQLWSGDHDPGLCHNTFLNFVVSCHQVSGLTLWSLTMNNYADSKNHIRLRRWVTGDTGCAPDMTPGPGTMRHCLEL